MYTRPPVLDCSIGAVYLLDVCASLALDFCTEFDFKLPISGGPNAPISCLSVDCVLRSCIPLSGRQQLSVTLW